MYSAIDTLWMMVAIVLIFMMQAGFTMLETGFTRRKNAGNIAMKNLMDFVVGALVFWIVGFSLMHNDAVHGIIGKLDIFSRGDYSGVDYPGNAYLVFQIMFCATSSTIVSGAMAERTKFSAYLVVAAVISALVYPISGCWIWNEGGWLRELGFHDFAGSTAVHVVGGTAALVGAKILGPRNGKYTKDGKSRAIPGHSISFGTLGIFLLWFGWYGFNAGSTLSLTGDEAIQTVSNIVLNVTISAAAACFVALMVSWRRYGKADPTMTINGALSGLVAITAGCNEVSAFGALCIGCIAGFVVVFAVEFVDQKLKIDDPVGAASAHGVSGMLGTVLTGVFSLRAGFLHTGRFRFFGVQILGTLVVFLWVLVSMTIVYMIIKKTMGLRVSEEDEIKGLDESQHGLVQIHTGVTADYGTIPSPAKLIDQIDLDSDLDDQEPLPEEYMKADGRMHKVVVIMNPNRLEALMRALDRIDITGMTVTNVSGCGMQKGNREYYRGTELESHLLPKVKVEIVIFTVPLGLLINTIKKTIHTGHIGDGKIFVYDVAQVIKVRTGEEGREALE